MNIVKSIIFHYINILCAYAIHQIVSAKTCTKTTSTKNCKPN